MKKRKIKFIIFAILIIIISIWLTWETNSIVITRIQYTNGKIPSEFYGYKILQISDLHNKTFGKNQIKLLEKIKECNPDIIVITGDLIDRKPEDINNSIELIKNIPETLPIYYVSGNHESYTLHYGKIKEKLVMANVTVLDNESILLSKNGQVINLIGLIDPNFYGKDNGPAKLNTELERLSNDDFFQILLCHRPELIDMYSNNNIDLVFTGHAHGGQIQLPYIGAIIAPDQGLFPKYTKGEYLKKNTTMIVNRGLGTT
ncbi:MAG: metallophosphoesterase, partial [Firmicutes bacterium]|nr:metallophosphoesterase [Bacillota bacterium]